MFKNLLPVCEFLKEDSFCPDVVQLRCSYLKLHSTVKTQKNHIRYCIIYGIYPEKNLITRSSNEMALSNYYQGTIQPYIFFASFTLPNIVLIFGHPMLSLI